MAKFDQIPKSDEELINVMKIGHVAEDKSKELLAAYRYTKQTYSNIEAPFSMSLGNMSKVKVLRVIATDELISHLKSMSSYFKFSPGDGSRTKKGFGSAGITFETVLEKDIQEYINAGDDASIADKNHFKFIRELWNIYELDKSRRIEIKPGAGLKRYRRTLQFSSNGVEFNDGTNIGVKVSDITISVDNVDLFLSLKIKDFSYFNLGIKSYLTEQEIKSGLIKNTNGKAILNMFGIDNEKFCQVFNSYRKSDTPEKEIITKPINSALTKFIKQAIGKGYHFVRKKSNGEIEHYKMTDSKLEEKSKASNVTVTYPYGSGKVIYVKFGNFEVHFRNNQSGIYPNVMIGYYKQR